MWAFAIFTLLAYAAPSSADIAWVSQPVATGKDRHLNAATTSANIYGKETNTAYVAVTRPGQTVLGDKTLGMPVNKLGNPIPGAQASTSPVYTDLVFLGQTDSSLFNLVYMMDHFQPTSKGTPSSVYATYMKQRFDGELLPDHTTAVDFSEYDGVMRPSGSQSSPWFASHIGTEKANIGKRSMFDGGIARDLRKQGWSTRDEIISDAKYKDIDTTDKTKFTATFLKETQKYNPYNWGWVWEAKFTRTDFTTSDAKVTVVKHYAIGRGSYEHALVMFDSQTVYCPPSGPGKPLIRFVADVSTVPGTLSSGELFAAKLTQLGPRGTGKQFQISWISLGHATNDEIKPMLTLNFNDIWEVKRPVRTGGPVCPAGFKAINAGGETGYTLECLKLKPGMEKAASRLETIRYAAYLGATTEFNRMSVTFDELRWQPGVSGSMWVSFSSVEGSMTNDPTRADFGGPNHVKLPANPCGAVYFMTLTGDFVATKLEQKYAGAPNTDTATLADNPCALERIANPGRVAHTSYHDGLFIAEDGDGHRNNVLWYVDLPSNKRSRILHAPYGAAVTSCDYKTPRLPFQYIWVNSVHPYSGESAALAEPENTGRAAWVGYIGPVVESP